MSVVCYRCPTSGEEVTTAIETGKDTLVKMRAMDLTIWVWCPHCMAMMPQERSLLKRYEGKPFALVGVNSDARGDKLDKAIKKQAITWRNFWDGGNSQGPIATRWNVQGWPAVYVLDDQGVIRFKHVRDEVLDHVVDVLMKERTRKTP